MISISQNHMVLTFFSILMQRCILEKKHVFLVKQYELHRMI